MSPPPSQVSQPTSKAPSSGSQHWEKVQGRHTPGDPSDDEPLSDKTDKPKAKSHKPDPTPDLVILEDDDNAPLPGKAKGMGKKTRTQTLGEEAIEALVNRLKGKARAVQYNLELAILTQYWNLHIPNLKGVLNTDDHSAYLSIVRDVSWSYPTKGNLITARQYYQDLKASKDPEAIEAGDNILWEKGMMGIPQESAKARPIKCRPSVVSRAKLSMPTTLTMDETGTSGCTISSARLPPKRLKGGVPLCTKAELYRGRWRTGIAHSALTLPPITAP